MTDRKPLLIRNWDIGSCVKDWTSEYVSNKVGSEPVKIHVTKDEKMDFINKNFIYKTLPFDELIRRVFRYKQEDYFIDPFEKYYMRSLGNDPRGRDVANFFLQCRTLAEDLNVPPFYDEKDFFSSVFRASSQGVQLWTHYDIMDNILIQVRGKKRIILWPPSEVDNIYLIGDKSEVLDIDNPDLEKYPKFKNAIRYECTMLPGDILFIPALWFHNTIAIEPCLGVNIFWKNLSHQLYYKNDSYGNKDLLPAAKSLHSLETAIKSLKILPSDYRNFYISRMIKTLKSNLTEHNDCV
ncbi:hypothetical protein RUM43_005038 [Polyplax serrata]|uniref:JmjC domain-containing protein n=1 Tax=Polyplax serrata TaxID=468196 RepID=A0AAN8SBG7_POLSC